MSQAVKGVQIALVVITLATTPFKSAAASSSEQLSYDEAVAALCQPQYIWDCGWVVQKAWDESNWKPRVVNYDCDNSGTYVLRCYGLLQLETGNAPNGDVEALKDVATNVYIAHLMYVARGKGPWGG